MKTLSGKKKEIEYDFRYIGMNKSGSVAAFKSVISLLLRTTPMQFKVTDEFGACFATF